MRITSRAGRGQGTRMNTVDLIIKTRVYIYVKGHTSRNNLSRASALGVRILFKCTAELLRTPSRTMRRSAIHWCLLNYVASCSCSHIFCRLHPGHLRTRPLTCAFSCSYATALCVSPPRPPLASCYAYTHISTLSTLTRCYRLGL